MVREDMSPTLAHDLLKLMFDHKAELAEIHPSAEKLTLEDAQKVVEPVQLHEGAKQYYGEAGDAVRRLVLAPLLSPPAAVARPPSSPATARAARSPSAALPADGQFALSYRHSVYKAAAEERFHATDGGFVLDSIASRDGRVLDYYELDGARTREGALWVLHPDHPARFTTMPLAATRRGQRTLVAGGRRVPAVRRSRPSEAGGGAVSQKTEELLDEYEAERPGRKLEGFPARMVAVLGAGLSLFAIFWVFQPLAPQVYRPAFLAVALLLTFVVFGRAKRPTAADYVVAVLALLAIGYAVFTPDLVRRAARPETLDILFGVASILLVLEATRRTTGWALPGICLAFLFYAYFGGLLPDWTQIGHKGYGIDRIVGQSYMGLEGIFGVPLDVAATYIVLFAIYGAVLELSGAARFFVEISFAAFGRSRTGPGRTSALAGFLLGTVSGSGVATTVTLGSVAWPLLRKAGYPKDQGGRIMAASGIGAILSPPTLGAAAFIIAEILEVSYLQVLVYALIPSILYYVGILMAIEADARRHAVHGLDIETPGVLRLLVRWGYHFSSLFLIVILLAVGFSAFRSVLIATVVAFALSFLDRRDWMGPRQIWEALVAGARGVLPIAATTAAAGIIVAVVSLTGLGLKLAGLIVDLAGGSLALTAVLSAVAVLILGLAVPVTASFIIAAAVVAPGARRPRRRGLRRLHVHLLLRGAQRGEPADRALGLRGRRDHRRQRLQDDDAHLPLHAAGVPRPVRVRARAQGRGAAAPGRPRHDRLRRRGLGHRGDRARLRARGLAEGRDRLARPRGHRRGRAAPAVAGADRDADRPRRPRRGPRPALRHAPPAGGASVRRQRALRPRSGGRVVAVDVLALALRLGLTAGVLRASARDRGRGPARRGRAWDRSSCSRALPTPFAQPPLGRLGWVQASPDAGLSGRSRSRSGKTATTRSSVVVSTPLQS